MTEPYVYYEDRDTVLWCGDCRDVLPRLDLDGCVLLTDPVYGVDGGSGGDARDYAKAAYARTGWRDDEAYVRDVCVPVIDGVLRRSVRGAVTPGSRCLTLYPRPADVGCFWTPAAATHGPWGFVNFHPILYYGRDFRAGKGAWPTGVLVTERAPAVAHPCPKPADAWRWLANKVSQPGDVLFDPFCGSGATLRAAKDLGRRAIGIEIEERYCAVAVARLAQQALPLEIAS